MKGNLSRHFSGRKPVYGRTFAVGMLAFAVLCLLGASRLSAQDTGYISGTVTDKSGAAIANANARQYTPPAARARTSHAVPDAGEHAGGPLDGSGALI